MPLVSKTGRVVTERVDGSKCEYSKSSLVLFRRILDYIHPSEHKDVFFATHNGEFKLGRSYYDFKYKKKLIEFSGNFFHQDPRIYSKTDKMMAHFASAIWAKDKEKKELAEKEGFELIVVWEDSYSKEPTIVLQKCINFILS